MKRVREMHQNVFIRTREADFVVHGQRLQNPKSLVETFVFSVYTQITDLI